MGLKERLAIKPTGFVLWRGGLYASLALAILLLVLVWLSGGSDTKDSIEEGRRLLIRLDTGAIEGKAISLDSQDDEHGERP